MRAIRRPWAGGVALRFAGPADLPELVRLEETVFASDPHRFSRRQWRRLIRERPEHLVVAARGERLLGALVLSRRGDGETLRVISLGVDPAARGEGIGRALLDHALEHAGRLGLARIRLEVRRDNEAAIQLYLRAGFREVQRLPSYYGLGEDGLRMERAMAAGGTGDSGGGGEPG